MVKNNNINIRIEVCKNSFSGKLSIKAHFDSNAPNVSMDKDGYVWTPTLEEKEFINEAFQLIPVDNFVANKEKTLRTEENFETKPVAPLSKFEKQKEPTVFNKTYDDTKDDRFEKNIFSKRPDIQNNRYEPDKEEPNHYENEAGKKDVRVIKESHDSAIEAALKRHMDDEDNPFVEADEQTIIDRVLNQKKKGKWNYK